MWKMFLELLWALHKYSRLAYNDSSHWGGPEAQKLGDFPTITLMQVAECRFKVMSSKSPMVFHLTFSIPWSKEVDLMSSFFKYFVMKQNARPYLWGRSGSHKGGWHENEWGWRIIKKKGTISTKWNDSFKLRTHYFVIYILLQSIKKIFMRLFSKGLLSF